MITSSYHDTSIHYCLVVSFHIIYNIFDSWIFDSFHLLILFTTSIPFISQCLNYAFSSSILGNTPSDSKVLQAAARSVTIEKENGEREQARDCVLPVGF